MKRYVWLQAVAQLAWKKGVCHVREAFHITFQHKTTFSQRLEIN